MSEPFLERVEHEGLLLALVLRTALCHEGTHFFTSPGLSQQLGYMKLFKGQLIEPHVHNPVPREITGTQEVLVVLRGRLRVDLYTSERQYVESRELGPQDAILMMEGGHGFEVLEPLDLLEIKPGPYVGEMSKTRFEAVDKLSVQVRGRCP